MKSNPNDPAWLDTVSFAGASMEQIKKLASAKRAGIVWFEHAVSHVRMRVIEQNPPSNIPQSSTTGTRRPTLVVLPDGPASIESYDRLVDQLSGAFTIVLVEIPGFGYSYPKDPQALEFEQTVAVTAAAVESLSLGPAIWVGPCVQGLVAIGVARLHPDLVHGLIVAQTGDWAAEIKWGAELLDPNGILRQPFSGQIAFRHGREKMAVDWWAKYAAGPDFDVAGLQREARWLVRNHCCYALASVSQKWFGRATEPQLTTDTPATVLWGMADPSHAQTDKRSVLRYLPNHHYQELARVGHFTDLEAIEVVRDQALRLLRV